MQRETVTLEKILFYILTLTGFSGYVSDDIRWLVEQQMEN